MNPESGSFHQQKKEPWFLQFFDFFLTFYLWRLM
jgi:hypothetical protein